MPVVFSIRKFLMVSVCGASILCLGVSSAQAGFEWTPPAKQVAPSIKSGIEAAPELAKEFANPNLLTPEPGMYETAPVAPVEGAALEPEDLVVPNAAVAPARTAPQGMNVVQSSAPVSMPAAETSTGMKTISSRDAIPVAQPEQQQTSFPRRKPERIEWNEVDSNAVKADLKGSTGNTAVSAPVSAPMPSSVPTAPAALTDAKHVEGFAKDISLALALSQVIPPSYAYKFADDVNPGQKVSWQGGKPWPQILSDMLTGSDLQVVIIGNTVTVEKTSPSAGIRAASVPMRQAAEPAPRVDESSSNDMPSASSNTKVARLSSEDAADLPVPLRSISLAEQAAEARAAEAHEKRLVEGIKAEASAPIAAVQGSQTSVVDVQTSRRWEASPGKTLRETLEGWGSRAGAEVEWMSPYDYPVDHAFVYEGKFDAAVDSILSLYSREQQRPRGRLYPNLPTGPSVLMIN
jgi:hypothetical protein